jgi:predicted transcriptional regulator
MQAPFCGLPLLFSLAPRLVLCVDNAMQTDFASQVEAFLERTGMKASRFGREAANDPHFVYTLRKGRKPWAETRAKVEAAMRRLEATE